MKNLIIGLIVLAAIGCNQPDLKKSKMEQAKIIEVVMWKSVDGIPLEEAKKAFTKLNEFVKKQPGFVARKTGLAADGRFVDIVYWTDHHSAQLAGEKAMKSEECAPAFSTIDEKEMTIHHFEIFNSLE